MIEEVNSDIIIRKGTLKDAEGIINLFKEGLNSNWVYTGSNEVTKEKIRKIKKNLKSKNPDSYSFVAINKNKVIGSTNFSFRKKGRLRHRAGLGWGVHSDYQRKGIGTKLLKTTLKFAKKKGFKRVEAEVAVKNIGSLKLAKKCGLKLEGRKKKALLTDKGRYIDTYILGKIL